jgi:hypothetical protein
MRVNHARARPERQVHPPQSFPASKPPKGWRGKPERAELHWAIRPSVQLVDILLLHRVTRVLAQPAIRSHEVRRLFLLPLQLPIKPSDGQFATVRDDLLDLILMLSCLIVGELTPFSSGQAKSQFSLSPGNAFRA